MRRPGRLTLGLLLAAGVGVLLWALVAMNPARSVSGEDWLRVVYSLGFVALVSASLFGRGLHLGQTVRYALVWLALVAALVTGFAFRDEIGTVIGRVRAELVPGQPVQTRPQEMAVAQDEDGHFYVIGAVNGVPVRFMVDTGASGIALTPFDAGRIGVDLGSLQFSRSFETANGVGRGARFVADSLAIGPMRLEGVEMSVNQVPMRASLLGLSYLGELESYEVRGRRLYLRWRSSPAAR